MRFLHSMIRVGDLDAALDFFCDKLGMIERGRVVWTGSSPELAAAPAIQHRYLGV